MADRRLPRQEGYQSLATLMATDNGLAIFRRFDYVNHLVLLSLQAEIWDLQYNFRYLCMEDERSSDDQLKMHARDFRQLRETEGGKSDQYQMLEELSAKVIAYNKLMLQVSQLDSLSAPTKSQLRALKDWLRDPKGGNNFQRRSEARLWEPNDSDGSPLVRIGASKGEHDIFTSLVSEFLSRSLHRLSCIRRTGRVIDPETGLTSYRDERVSHAGTVLVTILSSMLPVVTILVLYLVKNTLARIGITVGFTAAFAAILAIFSSAKRVEIFAATATFAAVEVVFIGSALEADA